MKKKETNAFPLILLGSTLLLLGAATYVYFSYRLAEEDIDFDLWEEEISDYA
ncbi:hypothetical protein [Pontibacter sp. HJ8]